MAAPLRHNLGYYGEDRYDVGANRVYSTQNASVNPFDVDALDSLASDNSPRTSFGEEFGVADAEVPSIGRLRRLSSLSKLLPSMPKSLTPKSSWTRMEDGLDERSDMGRALPRDEQKELRRKSSFLGSKHRFFG
jgi:hypothetical protein